MTRFFPTLSTVKKAVTMVIPSVVTGVAFGFWEAAKHSKTSLAEINFDCSKLPILPIQLPLSPEFANIFLNNAAFNQCVAAVNAGVNTVVSNCYQIDFQQMGNMAANGLSTAVNFTAAAAEPVVALIAEQARQSCEFMLDMMRQSTALGTSSATFDWGAFAIYSSATLVILLTADQLIKMSLEQRPGLLDETTSLHYPREHRRQTCCTII